MRQALSQPFGGAQLLGYHAVVVELQGLARSGQVVELAGLRGLPYVCLRQAIDQPYRLIDSCRSEPNLIEVIP